MRVGESLGLAARQIARIGWFYGQYAVSKRLTAARQSGAHRPGRRSGDDDRTARHRRTAARRAMIAAALSLLRRDLAQIRAGLYRPPPGDGGPATGLADMLAFFAALPAAEDRRWRRAGRERIPADAEGRFPDYYLRAFHYQDGGYFTRRSARHYDHQVEVLFTGLADTMRRQALAPVAHWLAARPAAGARLLDLGCGTGGFLQMVRHNWPELALTGLDLSPAYLDRARRRFRAAPVPALLAGNAETTGLPSASFELIACIYLLHELPGPARAAVLAEAARLLRPGGRLILLDSLQTGDMPALDPVLRGFPDSFHEPYYQDYLAWDAGRALTETGLQPQPPTPAWLSKLFTADKPT